MSAGSVELSDVQGLVARGYGSLPFAAYLLLEVRDAGPARRTLGGWVGQVVTAAGRPEHAATHVGLTAAGVDALRPGTAGAAGFSEQFVAGMTTSYRSRLLGDVDDDDPRGWAWGGPATAPVHLALLLYADTEERLAELVAARSAEAAVGGLAVRTVLETSELAPTENFGFRDGISQPAVEGFGPAAAAGTGVAVKAGEFVLGYPNEYGLLTDRPLLDADADPRAVLPRAPDGRADLGRNGTYLVLRTLRQDVEAFHAFTESASRDASGRPDRQAQARLAAKMVGRWPSGASLVLAPEHDDPTVAGRNDFGYQVADPRGIACPIGSHVRRSNPRDSLEPDPGSDASLAINRRHRLLRRGRGYGSPAAGECGLHFICLSANLARQYEFVQHSWVNNPAFNGMEDESDPVIGVRRGKSISFTTPGRPVRRRYPELPQFVHVRGGAYFFLPGIRALRWLAGT